MTDLYGDIYSDLYGGSGSAAEGLSRIRVFVDWDKSGDFDGLYDEVTGLVLREAGLSATYGRDQITALAPTVSGSASFTLDNADGRFSPRNTASPLYGYLKPSRPVLITREVEGTVYTLFSGHTDDQPIRPANEGPYGPRVTVSCVDWLADFRAQNISTQLYPGLPTGQAIGKILDAVGWPADLRDLDRGATVIPWWWEDGTDALAALEKLVRSEGPPAILHCGADGEIVFRDRHHRLTRETSKTSQQTWRDKGFGLVMGRDFTYDEAWDHIVNTGTVSVEVRAPSYLQPVWTYDGTISLSTGETRLVTATSSDPFYMAEVPVEGTDWSIVSGDMTASLLRTSGTSATIKLTAVDGAAAIANLQLRARPVTVLQTQQVTAEDQVSIAEYGRRSFPDDLPWCSPDDADAILQLTVALRAYPQPILTVPFMVAQDAAKTALLGLDLSTRVHVVEPATVVDADFYVESITHTLTGVHDHQVTFGLESAPTQVEPVFRLDTTDSLDVGYLGNPFIDTENLLILDSDVPGHRIDEGVFAA